MAICTIPVSKHQDLIKDVIYADHYNKYNKWLSSKYLMLDEEIDNIIKDKETTNVGSYVKAFNLLLRTTDEFYRDVIKKSKEYKQIKDGLYKMTSLLRLSPEEKEQIRKRIDDNLDTYKGYMAYKHMIDNSYYDPEKRLLEYDTFIYEEEGIINLLTDIKEHSFPESDILQDYNYKNKSYTQVVLDDRGFDKLVNYVRYNRAYKPYGKTRYNHQIYDILTQVNKLFGVDVEVVSEKEFKSIVNAEGHIYKGQQGIYIHRKRKVYLLDGSFDENTLIHELIHTVTVPMYHMDRELFSVILNKVLEIDEANTMYKRLISNGYSDEDAAHETIAYFLQDKVRIKQIQKGLLQKIIDFIKQILSYYFRLPSDIFVSISEDSRIKDIVHLLNKKGYRTMVDISDKDKILFSEGIENIQSILNNLSEDIKKVSQLDENSKNRLYHVANQLNEISYRINSKTVVNEQIEPGIAGIREGRDRTIATSTINTLVSIVSYMNTYSQAISASRTIKNVVLKTMNEIANNPNELNNGITYVKSKIRYVINDSFSSRSEKGLDKDIAAKTEAIIGRALSSRYSFTEKEFETEVYRILFGTTNIHSYWKAAIEAYNILQQEDNKKLLSDLLGDNYSKMMKFIENTAKELGEVIYNMASYALIEDFYTYKFPIRAGDKLSIKDVNVENAYNEAYRMMADKNVDYKSLFLHVVSYFTEKNNALAKTRFVIEGMKELEGADGASGYTIKDVTRSKIEGNEIRINNLYIAFLLTLKEYHEELKQFIKTGDSVYLINSLLNKDKDFLKKLIYYSSINQYQYILDKYGKGNSKDLEELINDFEKDLISFIEDIHKPVDKNYSIASRVNDINTSDLSTSQVYSMPAISVQLLGTDKAAPFSDKINRLLVSGFNIGNIGGVIQDIIARINNMVYHPDGISYEAFMNYVNKHVNTKELSDKSYITYYGHLNTPDTIKYTSSIKSLTYTIKEDIDLNKLLTIINNVIIYNNNENKEDMEKHIKTILEGMRYEIINHTNNAFIDYIINNLNSKELMDVVNDVLSFIRKQENINITTYLQYNSNIIPANLSYLYSQKLSIHAVNVSDRLIEKLLSPISDKVRISKNTHVFLEQLLNSESKENIEIYEQLVSHLLLHKIQLDLVKQKGHESNSYIDEEISIINGIIKSIIGSKAVTINGIPLSSKDINKDNIEDISANVKIKSIEDSSNFPVIPMLYLFLSNYMYTNKEINRVINDINLSNIRANQKRIIPNIVFLGKLFNFIQNPTYDISKSIINSQIQMTMPQVNMFNKYFKETPNHQNISDVTGLVNNIFDSLIDLSPASFKGDVTTLEQLTSLASNTRVRGYIVNNIIDNSADKEFLHYTYKNTVFLNKKVGVYNINRIADIVNSYIDNAYDSYEDGILDIIRGTFNTYASQYGEDPLVFKRALLNNLFLLFGDISDIDITNIENKDLKGKPKILQKIKDVFSKIKEEKFGEAIRTFTSIPEKDRKNLLGILISDSVTSVFNDKINELKITLYEDIKKILDEKGIWGLLNNYITSDIGINTYTLFELEIGLKEDGSTITFQDVLLSLMEDNIENIKKHKERFNTLLDVTERTSDFIDNLYSIKEKAHSIMIENKVNTEHMDDIIRMFNDINNLSVGVLEAQSSILRQGMRNIGKEISNYTNPLLRYDGNRWLEDIIEQLKKLVYISTSTPDGNKVSITINQYGNKFMDLFSSKTSAINTFTEDIVSHNINRIVPFRVINAAFLKDIIFSKRLTDIHKAIFDKKINYKTGKQINQFSLYDIIRGVKSGLLDNVVGAEGEKKHDRLGDVLGTIADILYLAHIPDRRLASPYHSEHIEREIPILNTTRLRSIVDKLYQTYKHDTELLEQIDNAMSHVMDVTSPYIGRSNTSYKFSTEVKNSIYSSRIYYQDDGAFLYYDSFNNSKEWANDKHLTDASNIGNSSKLLKYSLFAYKDINFSDRKYTIESNYQDYKVEYVNTIHNRISTNNIDMSDTYKLFSHILFNNNNIDNLYNRIIKSFHGSLYVKKYLDDIEKDVTQAYPFMNLISSNSFITRQKFKQTLYDLLDLNNSKNKLSSIYGYDVNSFVRLVLDMSVQSNNPEQWIGSISGLKKAYITILQDIHNNNKYSSNPLYSTLSSIVYVLQSIESATHFYVKDQYGKNVAIPRQGRDIDYELLNNAIRSANILLSEMIFYGTDINKLKQITNTNNFKEGKADAFEEKILYGYSTLYEGVSKYYSIYSGYESKLSGSSLFPGLNHLEYLSKENPDILSMEDRIMYYTFGYKEKMEYLYGKLDGKVRIKDNINNNYGVYKNIYDSSFDNYINGIKAHLFAGYLESKNVDHTRGYSIPRLSRLSKSAFGRGVNPTNGFMNIHTKDKKASFGILGSNIGKIVRGLFNPISYFMEIVTSYITYSDTPSKYVFNRVKRATPIYEQYGNEDIEDADLDISPIYVWNKMFQNGWVSSTHETHNQNISALMDWIAMRYGIFGESLPDEVVNRIKGSKLDKMTLLQATSMLYNKNNITRAILGSHYGGIIHRFFNSLRKLMAVMITGIFFSTEVVFKNILGGIMRLGLILAEPSFWKRPHIGLISLLSNAAKFIVTGLSLFVYHVLSYTGFDKTIVYPLLKALGIEDVVNVLRIFNPHSDITLLLSNSLNSIKDVHYSGRSLFKGLLFTLVKYYSATKSSLENALTIMNTSILSDIYYITLYYSSPEGTNEIQLSLKDVSKILTYHQNRNYSIPDHLKDIWANTFKETVSADIRKKNIETIKTASDVFINKSRLILLTGTGAGSSPFSKLPSISSFSSLKNYIFYSLSESVFYSKDINNVTTRGWLSIITDILVNGGKILTSWGEEARSVRQQSKRNIQEDMRYLLSFKTIQSILSLGLAWTAAGYAIGYAINRFVFQIGSDEEVVDELLKQCDDSQGDKTVSSFMDCISANITNAFNTKPSASIYINNNEIEVSVTVRDKDNKPMTITAKAGNIKDIKDEILDIINKRSNDLNTIDILLVERELAAIEQTVRSLYLLYQDMNGRAALNYNSFSDMLNHVNRQDGDTFVSKALNYFNNLIKQSVNDENRNTPDGNRLLLLSLYLQSMAIKNEKEVLDVNSIKSVLDELLNTKYRDKASESIRNIDIQDMVDDIVEAINVKHKKDLSSINLEYTRFRNIIYYLGKNMRIDIGELIASISNNYFNKDMFVLGDQYTSDILYYLNNTIADILSNKTHITNSEKEQISNILKTFIEHPSKEDLVSGPSLKASAGLFGENVLIGGASESSAGVSSVLSMYMRTGDAFSSFRLLKDQFLAWGVPFTMLYNDISRGISAIEDERKAPTGAGKFSDLYGTKYMFHHFIQRVFPHMFYLSPTPRSVYNTVDGRLYTPTTEIDMNFPIIVNTGNSSYDTSNKALPKKAEGGEVSNTTLNTDDNKPPISSYKPTKAKDKNAVYYSIPDIKDIQIDKSIIDKARQYASNPNSVDRPTYTIGDNTYLVDYGKDNKGEYISFYRNDGNFLTRLLGVPSSEEYDRKYISPIDISDTQTPNPPNISDPQTYVVMRSIDWRVKQKKYDYSDAIPLTQGRYNTGKLPRQMLKEFYDIANKHGIDLYALLAVVGQESTFGIGYLPKEVQAKIKSGEIKHLHIPDMLVISGWNLGKEYSPPTIEKFIYDKYAESPKYGEAVKELIDFKSDKRGYHYNVKEGKEEELKAFINEHPEITNRYNEEKKKYKIPKDFNIYEELVKKIKQGKMHEYNPGDKDYLNKLKEQRELLMNEPYLKKEIEKLRKTKTVPIKSNNID